MASGISSFTYKTLETVAFALVVLAMVFLLINPNENAYSSLDYYELIGKKGLRIKKWEIEHAESLCKKHEGLSAIVIHIEDPNRAICNNKIIYVMDVDLINKGTN